jgi:hypothetical protein
VAVSSWDDYRRYRSRFHAIWLGGFLVAAVVLFAFGLLGRLAVSIAVVLGPILVSGWLVALLATRLDFREFPCPKCGQPFFCGEWYFYPYRKRCAHCGLPKWSAPTA